MLRGLFVNPVTWTESVAAGIVYPSGKGGRNYGAESSSNGDRASKIPRDGGLFFTVHTLLLIHCFPFILSFEEGVKWHWHAEHEIAWMQAKDALSAAPVLGHPIAGSPYRLYTDASDYALGASLQQVQKIQVADLKGTTAYDKLHKAWVAGEPVPSLVTQLTKDVREHAVPDEWANSFEATTVHVERVIAYWSRTLKPAERNYSATEREALGAKEALVRFQPFIEGETIILITDHAALQWARVYENANRRLAAWGAVFAAYPGLKLFIELEGCTPTWILYQECIEIP